MFKSARIKLTAWYLAIIMVITISFSAFLYLGVEKATERALETQRIRMERQFDEMDLFRSGPRQLPEFNAETLIEIRQRTLLFLEIINLAVFGISASLGYFLAGRTLKPIEEMIQKQKRFTSDAAHEIKTPLTIMKTNLEVTLRDKNLSIETARESLESAIEEIDNLNFFTAKLLKQSRYQNINPKDKFVKVELSRLISGIAEKLKGLAEKRNENIICDLEPVIIKGDKTSLEELFVNLIENAIKYNHDGENVEIEMRENEKEVEIKIEDHGMGIDETELNSIFDPFYRTDKSRNKLAKDGFGLGLSIAKEIVELHNGKISVESKVGKGSVFKVTLPL
jgi:signal transduction histidine kinase